MIDEGTGVSIGLLVVAGGAVFGYGRLNQKVEDMKNTRREDKEDITKTMDKFETKLDRLSETMMDVRVLLDSLNKEKP